MRILVGLLMVFAGQASVFACGSQHGNATAASLNQIFGQTVATGRTAVTFASGVHQAVGDHEVYLEYNGASLLQNDQFWFHDGSTRSNGTALIQWLLQHGAKIKVQPGENKSKGVVREG